MDNTTQPSERDRAEVLKFRGRKSRFSTTLSDYERQVLAAIKMQHGVSTLSGALKSCIRAVGIKLGIGTNIFPNNDR